ncbi:type II toxin-antitoxin system RelE/ParE family toxin [Methylobacterium brachythecii]|uniref:Plasmid stabilization protein n=1 Tax=Methylobacterium brachythecii TaxID=1176177 RepID=A0A7W6F7C0_9HYPH|nr:type II toxin-antitoxin system RelE/ParE family toxin [Methylobacterium brachythecii]MBB3902916.1 toxin ParE1/3/4 [Methylobacterium brachythecii]GLS43842.1 plasmid stabilization protein [Methylobacterium brachythecii]
MGRIGNRPRARRDLIEIWRYVAEDNEIAADQLLDRIDGVLTMLGGRPFAGRERSELADGLRSFPVGNYVLFYLPIENGIELVRVLSRYLDIATDDFDN